MCQCDFCERGRRHKEICERRDVDELLGLIDELEEMLECTEFDLEVCEAVFEGSWPSSRRRLENALSKIDQVDDETLRRFQVLWDRGLPAYGPVTPLSDGAV